MSGSTVRVHSTVLSGCAVCGAFRGDLRGLRGRRVYVAAIDDPTGGRSAWLVDDVTGEQLPEAAYLLSQAVGCKRTPGCSVVDEFEIMFHENAAG
jgi:hypothetical protein